MDLHCTFHITLAPTPSTLPRILLAFSRRRLQIQALQYFELDPTRPADLQIDVGCNARIADDIARQLRRVVEVSSVQLEMQDLASARAPSDDRAAAA